MKGEVSSGSDVSDNPETKSASNPESAERSDHMDSVEDNVGQDTKDSSGKRYEINEDGDKEYRDDNGNVYRINDDLTPNSTYEINGYKYETDEQGRISSVSGQLHFSEEERKNIADSKAKIGKGDELETDDRGHLIADRFDGGNGLENMTPQDAHVNRSEVKKLENEFAERLDKGEKVDVKITPVYEDDSRRPVAYRYDYTVTTKDNHTEKYHKEFDNE